jgi:hypothetical protein
MANFQREKRTASGVVTGDPVIGQLVLFTPSGYLYTTRDDGTLVLINNGIPGPIGPSGVVGPSGAVGASGVAGPSGAVGAAGAPGSGLIPYYGSFYSNVNQTNASGTAVNRITYNNTVAALGVTVVSGSTVQVANSGVYNIQFSAQIQKSNASSEDMQIWIAKNNVNVPDSNTSITIQGSNNRLVAAWNWFLPLDTNEHVDLRWHSTDTTAYLLASGAANLPTRPAIPSVILTVNRVG